MRRHDAASGPSLRATWLPRVAVGTAATAVAASLLGGAVGLLVALGALAATLSGELLRRVKTRSRDVRGELLRWIAGVRAEHADETIDARSHDPFAQVGRMLDDYTPSSASAAHALHQLEETLARVDRLLDRTRAQRAGWATGGPPAAVGGLAGVSETGIDLKRYGDPATLPPWLGQGRRGTVALRVGRVLDDVRLLHSAEIEWTVLTFTLWARALLLVLAPALGPLSFAPAAELDRGWIRLAPWLLALGWALATALVAPWVATRAMEQSEAGRRTRRVLLVVELPLAIALALACPAWPALAFAAGWTNWWQRLGPSSAIPDFSWPRLAGWLAVTAAAQSVGLVLAPGELAWWQAAAEVALAIGVIAVIGGSYGAMLPVSAGIAVRVLLAGARHRRQVDGVAQRMIDDIAEAMTRAATELEGLEDRRPADTAAADVLRRAVDDMRPVAVARGPGGARTLGAVLVAALADGGHDMWVEDPRALAAQDRARAMGLTLPVVVNQPKFENAALADLVVDEHVAGILHPLLLACIVEARVHGVRRVQTIVRRAGETVEVRIANQPNPDPPRRRGRGRGGRTIEALARSLPGAGELFRGRTDRSFVGGPPDGELFGVRFTFVVGDTAPRAGSLRPGL